MDRQKKEMYVVFLMALGWRVRLGVDSLTKKCQRLQSPLCVSLILSIYKNFLSMRPSSVLKYLHTAYIVEHLQCGRQRVDVKRNKMAALPSRMVKVAMQVMRLWETVGVLWEPLGGSHFIPERSGEKCFFSNSRKNTGFGVGEVRFSSSVG